MFSFIKQMFIALLSFSESLAYDRVKHLFLSYESCMVRSPLINLNHIELKYYSFMISLDKCTGSCNVSSSKPCVPKERKGINVKLFNMIANKNKAKTMTKHTSCDYKCKSKYMYNM